MKIGSGDRELQMSMNSQASLSFINRAIGSLGSTIIPGSTPVDDEYEDGSVQLTHCRNDSYSATVHYLRLYIN